MLLGMGEASIQIRSLCLSYEGRRVVEDFSLDVESGEKVVLTGPSGTGKSTILKSVLGFVEPDSGTVRIRGRSVTSKTIWELRRETAYVAQEPDLGSDSVADTIEHVFDHRANRGLKHRMSELDSMLDRFSLSRSLRGKKMGDLSGGEKQRVAVIRALLLDRPVLLLDEVTSALDSENRRRLAEALCECEASVLIVSHDQYMMDSADRVVHLDGRKAER